MGRKSGRPLPFRWRAATPGVDEEVARCDDVEILDLGLVRLGGAAARSATAARTLPPVPLTRAKVTEATTRPVSVPHTGGAGRRGVAAAAARVSTARRAATTRRGRPCDVGSNHLGRRVQSDRAGRVAPPTLEGGSGYTGAALRTGNGHHLGGIIVIVGILVLILWSTIWASSSSSSACSPSEVLRGAAGTDQAPIPGLTRRFGRLRPASFTLGLSGSARAAPRTTAACRPDPARRRASSAAAACARARGSQPPSLGRHLLPVGGSGRARDGLVHERAAEVVRAGAQRRLRAVDPELHPRRLHVRDVRMQRQPPDRVHEDRLAERRPRARAALQEDRRLHVHERKRHELREPTGLLLLVAEREEMPAQLRGPSTAPNMIVVVERRPTRCAWSWTRSHWAVVTLSGQRTRLTSSSRISAAVPGRGEPEVLQALQVGASETPSVAAPCQTSSAENACTCRSGRRRLIASHTCA